MINPQALTERDIIYGIVDSNVVISLWVSEDNHNGSSTVLNNS